MTTNRKNITLTATDLKRLAVIAAERECSQSQAIRTLIREASVRDPSPAEWAEIRADIQALRARLA
jgi:macrodomain Ter protein organizer (MatP/YcbG family)